MTNDSHEHKYVDVDPYTIPVEKLEVCLCGSVRMQPFISAEFISLNVLPSNLGPFNSKDNE